MPRVANLNPVQLLVFNGSLTNVTGPGFVSHLVKVNKLIPVQRFPWLLARQREGSLVSELFNTKSFGIPTVVLRFSLKGNVRVFSTFLELVMVLDTTTKVRG